MHCWNKKSKLSRTRCVNFLKERIKKRIAELAAKRKERLKVSSDRVIEELAKIALADGAGDMAGFSIELKDKIKALELLGKTAGTFNNDDSGKATINVSFGKKK